MSRKIGTWSDYISRGAEIKARPRQKAPKYIASEVSDFDQYDLFKNFLDENEDAYERLAIQIPWVYSNIVRIANEVSSTPLWLYKKEDNAKIQGDEHLYPLITKPNSFFSFQTLLQYTIWSLMLSDNGAYWYLVPNPRNKKEIIEIWPIVANRVVPIKNESKFISGYRYTANSETMILDPRYVIRFFLPHPTDYWRSLTPISALRSGIDIFYAISTSQKTLFREGGGVPLSIVLLDKNITDRDFEVTKQNIRDDWENQRRIAVARGGSLDVKNVGISNRDLEVIASQTINRDTIDSTFMTIPYRSEALMTGDGLKEANRQIKEYVIHPLHSLLAAQIQIHFISQFYENFNQIELKFDDVREQDRALLIQQWNVEWRAKSMNEARTALGIAAFENPAFPGLGELPLQLATNASFVASLYNINGVTEEGSNDSISDDVGNISGSMAPEMTTNMIAAGEKSFSPAEKFGIVTELKRYETIVKRVMQRKNKKAHEIEFGTEIIPKAIMRELLEKLNNIDDLVQVAKEFDTIKERFS